MTPEQKLKHLREWMDYFINYRATERIWIDTVWDMFENFGILPYRPPFPELMPFEKYIQSIENK